ncbi:S-layer homology domain-containing protein [Neomoorella humiferrea]|uniref:SLH domain-containing protein n=2 Tax=Neomoorella humiferrea TaxID=676965 RepID=A0A2T0AN48_9FIRM|nr:S-layer homology domain-containing protein [Moorella humiferrea]PRR70305.1 hypothetical protein MOHU_20960 [Moorella humiferrea]
MAWPRMTLLFTWLTLLLATVFCGETTGQPLNSQTLGGQAGAEGRLMAVQFADMEGHWARVPVMRLAGQGIISGRGDGRFDPEAPVTRIEALNLLGRAAGWEASTTGTGQNRQGASYLPAAAQKFLTTKEKAYTLADWQAPAARQEVAAWVGRALGLAPAGTAFLPALASFQDSGEVDGELAPMVEAVLQESLMAGVQAGIFAPRQAMTRAEMAALLDRLDGRLASLRGASRLEGQVVDRVETWTDGGGRIVTLRVATFGGPVVGLQIELGANGESLVDFLLYKNGALTLGRGLNVGDTVKLFLQGEKVLYAEASPGAFNIGGSAASAINGPTATPAYNQGDIRMVNGYLREINDDKLVVVDGAGNERSVAITGTTTIIRSGHILLPDDLKTGDQVKVQMDGRGRALTVQVGNDTNRLGRVLRGKVDRVNPLDGKIVLRDTGEFFYGTWLPGDSLKTLKLSRDAVASLFGSGGSLGVAAGGFNGEVLTVLEDGTGSDTATAVTKAGASMRLYEGTLEDLYLGSGEMFLEGEDKPLLLTNDTIFIKNGQKVAAADFKAGDYVFMVAAGPGTGQALMVYGTDVLPASWRLYRGEIEEVKKEGFTLYDVEVMGYGSGRPFDWEETEDDKDFNLDWEPVIMGQGGEMSRDDFTAGRFTGDYEGDYAYVLARGNTAHGLLVLPDDAVGPTMTSLGRLKGIDRDDGTVTLTAVRDWSTGYGRWQDRDEDLELDARRALVLKGRKIGAPEELVPGDVLYVVHDGRQALVLMVAD